MTGPNEDEVRGRGAITRLLPAWGRGGEEERALFDLLEPELRQLARSVLRNNPDVAHKIEPGEVVSETYLRLKRYLDTNRDVSFENRRRFFQMVLSVMRHVVLDVAKRGGHHRLRTTLRLPLSAVDVPATNRDVVDALAFYETLDRLRQKNERQADAIELHYIAGWSLEECANLMDLSTATLKRQLAAARQWFEVQLTAT